jgi:hypothetical protein
LDLEWKVVFHEIEQGEGILRANSTTKRIEAQKSIACPKNNK